MNAYYTRDDATGDPDEHEMDAMMAEALQVNDPDPTPTRIVVSYRSIDRFSQRRTFKTLKGARAYAQGRVGRHPDISLLFGYAVDTYGTGTLRVTGVHIEDLFPGVNARGLDVND